MERKGFQATVEMRIEEGSFGAFGKATFEAEVVFDHLPVEADKMLANFQNALNAALLASGFEPGGLGRKAF